MRMGELSELSVTITATNNCHQMCLFASDWLCMWMSRFSISKLHGKMSSHQLDGAGYVAHVTSVFSTFVWGCEARHKKKLYHWARCWRADTFPSQGPKEMQLQGLINLFVTIELLDILSMLGCKEQILLVSFCVVRSREVWVSLAVGTEDCKKHATYKMRHRYLQLHLF